MICKGPGETGEFHWLGATLTDPQNYKGGNIMTHAQYQKKLQESQKVVSLVKKEFQNPETMGAAIAMTKASYNELWDHKMLPATLIYCFEVSETFLKELQSKPIYRFLEGVERGIEAFESLFGFELNFKKSVLRRLFPSTTKKLVILSKMFQSINKDIAKELEKDPEFQKYVIAMVRMAEKII
jgi:hypothetical protein